MPFSRPCCCEPRCCCRAPTPSLCLLRSAPASLLPSTPSRLPGRSTRQTRGSAKLSPWPPRGGWSQGALPGCRRQCCCYLRYRSVLQTPPPAPPGALGSGHFLSRWRSPEWAAGQHAAGPSPFPGALAPLPHAAPGNPAASCCRIAPEAATFRTSPCSPGSTSCCRLSLRPSSARTQRVFFHQAPASPLLACLGCCKEYRNPLYSQLLINHLPVPHILQSVYSQWGQYHPRVKVDSWGLKRIYSFCV